MCHDFLFFILVFEIILRVKHNTCKSQNLIFNLIFILIIFIQFNLIFFKIEQFCLSQN